MSDFDDDFPVALHDAAQSAALDRRLIADFGVAGFTLMQRAATAAFHALVAHWPHPGTLCVLCGPGNNGGDGFLVACNALAAGWRVRLYCLVPVDALRGDAARAAEAFGAAGGVIEPFEDAPITADVVVDALLGTGLNRDVEGDFARAIERVNDARQTGAGVLAIDIPSGIDAGSGRIWAHAVRADVTPTFIALKLGQVTGAGPACCGELVFDALQAPAELYADQARVAERIVSADRRRTLGPRALTSHKSDHGHVLCIGGNAGMGGAIRMSAEAALRTGAGLVSVGCHRDHAGAMSQARPELMCRALGRNASIARLIAAADVIAIGPGLGSDGWAEGLWQQARDSDKPLVVDADALNQLARQPSARGNWILTPHPGEAARLLDCAISEIVNDRPGAARELARRYHAVVVLKGAGSLVATADTLRVCTAGNPGMAVGGMGDVLTGVIVALRGQGLSAAEAAAVGVHLHASAGDLAAAESGERGLLPSDLFPLLRRLANPEPA